MTHDEPTRTRFTPAIPPQSLGVLCAEMTLRDYFAAAALMARGYAYGNAEDELAAWAYRQADAMLRARRQHAADHE